MRNIHLILLQILAPILKLPVTGQILLPLPVPQTRSFSDITDDMLEHNPSLIGQLLQRHSRFGERLDTSERIPDVDVDIHHSNKPISKQKFLKPEKNVKNGFHSSAPSRASSFTKRRFGPPPTSNTFEGGFIRDSSRKNSRITQNEDLLIEKPVKFVAVNDESRLGSHFFVFDFDKEGKSRRSRQFTTVDDDFFDGDSHEVNFSFEDANERSLDDSIEISFPGEIRFLQPPHRNSPGESAPQDQSLFIPQNLIENHPQKVRKLVHEIRDQIENDGIPDDRSIELSHPISFSITSSPAKSEAPRNSNRNNLDTRTHRHQTPSHGFQSTQIAGRQSEPNYEFGYGVEDRPAALQFGHTENRRGKRVEGEYYVLLPNGYRQIVTYYADETGYHPTVKYEPPIVIAPRSLFVRKPNNALKFPKDSYQSEAKSQTLQIEKKNQPGNITPVKGSLNKVTSHPEGTYGAPSSRDKDGSSSSPNQDTIVAQLNNFSSGKSSHPFSQTRSREFPKTISLKESNLPSMQKEDVNFRKSHQSPLRDTFDRTRSPSLTGKESVSDRSASKPQSRNSLTANLKNVGVSLPILSGNAPSASPATAGGPKETRRNNRGSFQESERTKRISFPFGNYVNYNGGTIRPNQYLINNDRSNRFW